MWSRNNAIAYNAKDVSDKVSMKVLTRERSARVKMFLDLFLGKAPKFMAKKLRLNKKACKLMYCKLL